MNNETQFMSRSPNWLPLPGIVEMRSAAVQAPQQVDDNDGFSKGTVEEFYPHQSYGYIKTDRGERLRFSLKVVMLAGAKTQALNIKEGIRVGYDVGITSEGMRVSTLKIY